MHADSTNLQRKLDSYAQRWPDQAAVAVQFRLLLDEVPLGDGENPFRRERLAGHFTGSAWLVSGDGSRVLLTHHRKLGIWIQLGGHADGDVDLARVALREAEEESGLTGLRVDPQLFDLDRHWIPECNAVPGHWHYDARFIVRAGPDENFVVSEESLALAWMDIREIAASAEAEASLKRMANRWLAMCDCMT